MGISGKKVVIVGGGIAALACANALAQRGAKVCVYEQATELGEVGAGIQISSNGVAVLEALGLRAAAEPFANAPKSVDMRDLASGESVASLAMGETAVRRWGRPYWQFHRADILAVLADGARQVGVDIRLGQTIGSVSDIDADVIIAADGVRSNIRAEVFGGQKAQFTGQVAWRGTIPTEKLAFRSVNAATVYMGPGRHLVTYPLRGGTLTNFVAVEERDHWADEGWNLPDPVENLRAAFSNAAPEVLDMLNCVEDTFLWGLFNHPTLKHWTKGNIAMVGDACHPMLPFLAQGAVMALEDAWVIARELDKSDTVEHGLQSYERIRKSRATRVQNAAKSNATAYHLRNSTVRGVAHFGLKGISTFAPHLLLGKFDWLYGHDVTLP